MKSKLHLRRRHKDNPNHHTEIEVDISGQEVTGVSVIKKGGYNVSERFPTVGSDVKVDLIGWCQRRASHEVKLPSEPESAYRHIENMMQLGDALGCARID